MDESCELHTLTVVAESLNLWLNVSVSLSHQTQAATPSSISLCVVHEVWPLRQHKSIRRLHTLPISSDSKHVFACCAGRFFGGLWKCSSTYNSISGPLVPFPPLLISLWSASKWHACLTAFITALWWMSHPHLHNTAGTWGVQMEGKLQELSLSTRWLFLTTSHWRLFKHSFLLVGGACSSFICRESKFNPNVIRGGLKNMRRCVKEGEHLIPSSSRTLGTATKGRESSFPKPWSQDS